MEHWIALVGLALTVLLQFSALSYAFGRLTTRVDGVIAAQEKERTSLEKREATLDSALEKLATEVREGFARIHEHRSSLAERVSVAETTLERLDTKATKDSDQRFRPPLPR